MFSKSRSSTSSYAGQMNSADHTVTVALPTPTHSDPNRAAELAMLQYQQELLADFFSGGAAPRPRPPPPASSSGHSHTHSTSSSKTKTKWGGVLVDRDAKAKANVNVNVYPEPTTLSKRMFQFGFACPLLWLVGAAFLIRPPRPRIEHEGLPVNSEEERGRRIAVYEAAEARWAWRCWYAWLPAMTVIPIVVAGVVLGTRDG